ncbi:hypothetical protein CC78DRAFT_542906 [Lojkania enalia]|uniref:Zn(2)-C6 fungal-type domain-containing protein n=1 Tax=Lojkania enalia TaxID=147567 RepID=A0A9P4KDP3_9PLEO|nr:hypothetical protein CC78DRAFT_542906 [Didymosphaeria enalia]
MSQRRAIACTICAKAKTKCDKAVPSCSRCTAKGLPCEPRSTRRTSDSSYRNTTKKHVVSPKRFPSTSSIPTISRHGSPRSVPTSNRHQLVRAVSQMDMATASKMGHQVNFAGLSMLTPLQTYTPHIVDEYYTDFSSPEPNMSVFAPHMAKNNILGSGRLTPQTPEPFAYNEPLSIADPFDQYTNSQAWSDDGHMPIGLGLENEGLMLQEPDMRMWSSTELDNGTASMGHMQSFNSPASQSPSLNAWPEQSISVSPPQPPHTRAVPSLSISECSVQEYDSPEGARDEWSDFRINGNEIAMAKPNASAAFMENVKAHPTHPQWEDVILPRSSTF